MAKSLAAQHSDDIVDILTRTNASLQPASTSRISSLYVFDAIARAAKSDAALLGKMEAAVGGFVDSIIDNGKGGVWSEGRVSCSSLCSDGCSAQLGCCDPADQTGQDAQDCGHLAQVADVLGQLYRGPAGQDCWWRRPETKW